jgi:hypothetical protein
MWPNKQFEKLATFVNVVLPKSFLGKQKPLPKDFKSGFYYI